MGHKATYLSAHSDGSKSPVTSLSLPLQLSLRQFTWLVAWPQGVNPDQVSLFLPITPLGEACLTSRKLPEYPTPHLHWRPASSPSSAPLLLHRRRLKDTLHCRLPGTELFKCATSLMSVSYSLGWTLIKNYVQLLGQWGWHCD